MGWSLSILSSLLGYGTQISTPLPQHLHRPPDPPYTDLPPQHRHHIEQTRPAGHAAHRKADRMNDAPRSSNRSTENCKEEGPAGRTRGALKNCQWLHYSIRVSSLTMPELISAFALAWLSPSSSSGTSLLGWPFEAWSILCAGRPR